MRLEDDLPTPPPASRVPPRNLEPMGVAELGIYIEELRAEIARAEAEIARKGRTRDAAEAFFKFKTEG